MNKLIILYKDGSISIIKEKRFKYNKKMKYVLVPINSYDIENTFICLYANKYMDFEKAEIEVDMLIARYDDYDKDEITDTNPLTMGNISTTSVIDFYNYLHSLYKIELFNNIINANMENPNQINIDLLNFKVRLFENGETLFEFSNNRIDEYSDEPEEFETVIDVDFYAIHKKLEKIYKPINSDMLYNETLAIDYSKKKWVMKKKFKPNENYIWGIALDTTHSMYFMRSEELSAYDTKFNSTRHLNLDIISAENDVDIDSFGNLDELSEFLFESGTVDYYDSIAMYITHRLMLEVVVYIKYIYSTIMFVFNELMGNDAYDIITTISFNGYRSIIIFNRSQLPTMIDLLGVGG